MSPPEVVVLDTRGVSDKAGFLAACARDLGFPDYFGGNWDAFEECLVDFVEARRPVLVVWTGASGLQRSVHDSALEIMTQRFVAGADLLIVDDVTITAQPDFALDHVQLAIPAGSEPVAREYWVSTIGLVPAPEASAEPGRGLWLTGDALNLRLGAVQDFQPATRTHPAIMVRDFDALVSRLRAGDHEVHFSEIAGARRFQTDDPFGNRLEFIAF